MAIKTPQQNKKAGTDKNKKPGSGLISNLITALFIFLIIGALYSYVSDLKKVNAEIPLSQVASDVSAGKVTSIVISGEELEITYKAEQGKTAEVKKSKKEAGTALTETFAKYGIASTTLSSVSIDIKNESGFLYWFLNLAPFLLPILFVVLFLWYLSRQVKGAGMQAFTFGQSKARLTQPNDKKQRVTFNDVAGAKEAKEELKEIVDFLRSPKKFFDMGARIPKGILLMGAPGTGKCIVGDSLILTNKGLVTIKDIPKYFSVNPKNNKVYGATLPTVDLSKLSDQKQTASHWYDLGLQKTKKVILKMGQELEGTHEHPIVIMNSKGELVFQRLDKIQKGDLVAVKFNTNIFGSSKEVSSEQAYIMGLLTGDGNLSHASRIGFTTVDKELALSFGSYMKSNYSESKLGLASDGITHVISSWKAKKDFYDMGMSYLLSYDKAIPPQVLQASKDTQVAFLQGLFDSDGYFERCNVGYGTVSKKMSEEVMAILLNLGILATRRIKSKISETHKRPVYEIMISGTSLQKFAKEIGFKLKRKQEALLKYLETHECGNTNVDLIYHIEDKVVACWKEMSLKKKSTEGLSKLVDKVRTRKRISRNSLSLFVDRFEKSGCKHKDFAFLKNLLNANLFFSEISKIEEGEAEVFDFTVPKTHSFVSNGMISHNTLLARATAGEANVAFFSISGSEFVEMFVGVGASRVRDLFAMAKASAPAIIFIDEIDAVGRTRGTGMGGGNDEREQTLNQILVEMDGFEPTEKVIVMAATNRPDVLDPAILRPGRFDRRVVIDLPDRGDREEILKIHGRGKPFAEDVNIALLAERTPGFSGADLYSLMNEGAILAAREGRNKIAQFDLIRAIEKVMLGPERKSHLLSVKEKEITAYHEAGHAIVASVLPYADPVHKISIISRGRAAGYTLKLPLEDRKLQSKNEFMDDIAMSLGGYITEKMIFGDVTTGPSNDLQVSTALARDMVTRYGMSDKIGAMALEGAGGKPLFGGQGMDGKEYSERMGAEIDSEVSLIMKTAYDKAEKIITEYKHVLDAIAKKLIEVETIEKDEYELLISAHGIPLKKKKDIEHQE